MRLYAIGDVHGQYNELRRCHALISVDRMATRDSTAPVVHLGDYPDRGPRTMDVIDFLIEGQARGEPWLCLLGNHDRMMRLYVQDPSGEDPVLRSELSWLHPALGGIETLASYGVSVAADRSFDALHRGARASIPKSHIAFLDGLQLSFETDTLFLCHAGIRPGVPLHMQVEDDLIWIRGEFHNDERDHGKLVVHGHTPVDAAIHAGNRINLDTGAGYGRAMTVAVFEDRECWLLGPTGRTPLVPV